MLKSGLQGMLMAAVAVAMVSSSDDPPAPGYDTPREQAMWRHLERQEPVVMTTELIDECIEIAMVINPSLAEQFNVLRKQDPAKFRKALQTNGRQLIALAQLKQNDPDLYTVKIANLLIDAEVSDVARQLRVALRANDTDKVDQLEQLLLSRVNAQIILSLTERERYLNRLRDVVKQLECELEDDRLAADQLIRDRFDELLGADANLLKDHIARRVP